MNSVLTCSCPFRGRASAEVFPITPTVTRILPLGSGHYSRTALLVAGITFLVSSGGPDVCWAEYLHPVDLHLRKTIQLPHGSLGSSYVMGYRSFRADSLLAAGAAYVRFVLHSSQNVNESLHFFVNNVLVV